MNVGGSVKNPEVVVDGTVTEGSFEAAVDDVPEPVTA